ncbi:putative cytochrome P450 [Podospora didyma]|uniref:Cytochrome P450 n=1 Tax=Podospora didyma TaxID=330526 RepID=A0AAE0KDM5_9PEZI|nr:putative cytochrome P450 [Podospora didyma]
MIPTTPVDPSPTYKPDFTIMSLPQTNLWTPVYGVLTLLLALIISSAIYNIFFHPLRKFPGPLFNRASPLQWSIWMMRGKHPREVEKAHRRYGPVVRIGPNHLSFTDVEAWKDIYGGKHGQVAENAKPKVFYNAAANIAPHILNAQREEHTLLRRALAPGFSDRALRAQEPLVARYIDLLCQRLRENCESGKRALDLVPWYNWTTFDIAGDLVLAESFHCLQDQKFHPFVSMITDTVAVSSIIGSLTYIGLIGVIMKLQKLDALHRPLRELMAGVGEKLKKRLEDPRERDDLFEGLMKHREEWNLEMPRLQANATILIAAGSETTATLLSGATYLVLSHPSVLAEVTHEVRSAFSDPSEITITSVTRLPYLVACLNESLRHYPPVAGAIVREVSMPGGTTIAGHFVPEGTIVETHPWAQNHRTDYWHDPWAFKPERFLDDSPEKDRLDALQPFSFGPRNCIGKNLAYAEMRLIFARIIYDFDMRLAEPDVDWIKTQKVFNLWAKKPLKVHLTPVDHGVPVPATADT